MTDLHDRQASRVRSLPRGGRSVLSLDDRQADHGLSCSLAVALDDPYFFDHPLDHVPGLALVSGLLDIVRSGGGELEADDRRIAFSFRFPRFCELNKPVRLEAIDTLDGELAVAARQGDTLVCEGSVSHRSVAQAGPTGPIAHPAFERPADADLVHRVRPENILISSMAQFGDNRVAAVLTPPQGHFLATVPGTAIRAETVVDAARQFGIMILHQEHGKPMGTQFVLASINAEWQCDLASPVYLRWAWTPPTAGRVALGFDLVTADPVGEQCGRIDFRATALSPAAYYRMRAACSSKAARA